MKFSERISQLNFGISNIYQTLTTVGLICALLYGWYQTHKTHLIEENAEETVEHLRKYIDQLGLMTKADFDSAMAANRETEISILNALAALNDFSLVQNEQLFEKFEHFDYDLTHFDKEIDFLKREMLKTQRSIGGALKSNAELIKERAYTDSLQNELQRVQMLKRSSQIIQEMREYRKENIKLIREQTETLYPNQKRKGKGKKFRIKLPAGEYMY